jgi:serine/threonine-protein kinase
MLAGRTPFEGAPIGLLVKHIHEPPPPLKSWPAAASVPDPIAQLVMRNLAKDPRQRAQDARAFAADLAAAAEASGITIPMAHAARRLNHLPGVDPTIDDAHPPPPPVLPVVEKKPPPEKQPVRPRWLAPAIALSFVAAIGITAIVTRRLTSPDPDHAAFIERTRRALADGHYVAPPGENVYDLVEQGQKTWPNDITLRELRSQAEHEMITMAMAAHASGDIVGARNLARDAYRLDSTDNSARFMRAQAEDDLASIVSGAGIDSGPPRLVFESPPVVRTGEKVVMTCRIVPGQAGPKAKVTSIKLSIFPNGQTTGGVPVSLVQTDPWHVRAEIVAPSVQSWDVTFEAAVDGTFVRAMRDLDVIP